MKGEVAGYLNDQMGIIEYKDDKAGHSWLSKYKVSWAGILKMGRIVNLHLLTGYLSKRPVVCIDSYPVLDIR